MRLWHKDLIPYLPRQQLLGQWRECCLIARNIALNGTPNHILVNIIMAYPDEEFIWYGLTVYDEMISRGYSANESAFTKHFNWQGLLSPCTIFKGWHDDIYLRECLYNLEEKYRAGGITDAEWAIIYGKFCMFTPLCVPGSRICISASR